MHSRILSAGRRFLPAVLLVSLCGGAASPPPGAALIPTNVAGMWAVRGPAAGFDPMTASEAALSRFGFPRRPDPAADPAGSRRWMQAMRAARQRVVPVIGPYALRAGRMRPGAGPRSFRTSPSNSVGLDTFTWSGLALQDLTLTPGTSGFTNIAAEFNVPIAQTPPNQCSGYSLDASLWVGIDGFADADPGILQAGIDDFVQCDPVAGSFTGALPWFEWYPDAPHEISNLQVTPGDVFYVAVSAIGGTTGSAFLLDETSGQYSSVQFPAPAGMHLAGDSAEWIVEAPSASPPNYVAAWFDGMAVTTGDARTYGTAYPATLGTVNLITMDDDSGAPISTAEVLGRSSMLLHTQGSLTPPLSSQ